MLVCHKTENSGAAHALCKVKATTGQAVAYRPHGNFTPPHSDGEPYPLGCPMAIRAYHYPRRWIVAQARLLVPPHRSGVCRSHRPRSMIMAHPAARLPNAGTYPGCRLFGCQVASEREVPSLTSDKNEVKISPLRELFSNFLVPCRWRHTPQRHLLPRLLQFLFEKSPG